MVFAHGTQTGSQSHPLKRIAREKVIVIAKDSKVDYDARRFSVSPLKLPSLYREMGYSSEKIKAIWESHDLQQQGKELLLRLFNPQQFILRENFDPKILSNCDLVISFGGDNHFQYLARYLKNTPLLGINADPPRSEGALTQITVNQLPLTLDMLNIGRYKLEEWSRMTVKVNGKESPFPVLCEVFAGEHRVENMSRLLVQIGSNKFVHKGSGMLLYTGAGSSGWAYSVEQVTFAKTDKYLRFVFMNPYIGKLSPVAKNANAYFPKNQRCTITSLNDAEGVLVLDALETVPFPEGSTAQLLKGPPLKVIQPLL